MKDVKVFGKTKLICLLLVFMCAFSVFTVSAVPEESPEEDPGYVETVPEDYPEETPEEEYPEEEYPEETPEDEPTQETESTEGITESETESSSEEETTETESYEEPEPSYRAPLPEIEEESVVIPEPIGGAMEENEPDMFWGFVCWICIGVGVAVILAVLLTTKTRAYRAGGKKRYASGDKISGKQRLLNDKYYSNKRK